MSNSEEIKQDNISAAVEDFYYQKWLEDQDKKRNKFVKSPIFIRFNEWWAKRKGKEEEEGIAWEAYRQASLFERRLQDTVVMFRNKHQISCPEEIWQLEDAHDRLCEFTEQLMELVGYLQENEYGSKPKTK